MDTKKAFIFVGLMMILMINMVSAVWWNPFTWFQDDGATIDKAGGWALDHLDGVQRENFNVSIENLDNGKAKLCLISKTPRSINDPIIQESRATLRSRNIETRIVQPSDMEIETEQGKVKKMCIDVDASTEDYARFGSNSALFVYTSESITATLNGEEIGRLSLITEDFKYKNGKPNIQTGVGDGVLTHTFFIENYDSDAITNLRSINMRNDQEVERNAHLRFLSYEDVEVATFETICPDQDIDNCYNIANGSRMIQSPRWINMSQAIIGHDYVVGIFADTENGDYIDVDFDYYGVSVLESPIDWATWESSLYNDIIAYYMFDEASGDAVDSTGTQVDATATGITYGNAGIIGDSFTFGGATDVVDLNFYPSSTAFTMNVWVYITSSPGTTYRMFSNQVDDDGIDMSVVAGLPRLRVLTGNGDEFWDGTTDLDTVLNEWHLLTLQHDNSDNIARYYFDGINEHNYTTIGDISWGTADIVVGNRLLLDRAFPGRIDGVSFFERRLTQQEVRNIYLSGVDGNEYNPDADDNPTITNEQPANNTVYTTTTTVNFNATVYDDINLENVSLIIDGSIDQTNTSGTNNSLYVFTKSLSAGLHNWSIIAFDNSSQNTTTDLRWVNISIVPPTIELSYPADNLVVKNLTQTIYAYVYDNIEVDNVSLYIDGVLNETNSSGLNATNYSFTKTFVDGSFDWYVKAIDNQGFATDSATRTLKVNTTPFIAFLTPPTLVNYANITQEYIPMKVNVSTLYFDNITYSLRNVNGTNYTQFYNNETFDINFTDMPDGHYHYDVTVCTTTSKCNVTETRHINHDVTPPTVNITSPSLLNNLGYNGLNVNFTANFSDDALDSCWYNYNGTNTTFPCTNNQFNTTSFALSNYDTDMIFYANDTFGNLLIENFDWDYIIYYINNTYEDPAVVGETSTFTYDAYWLNDTYSSINAYVNWNGVRKPLATTTKSGNLVNVTSTFLLTGLTVDTNVTFLFEFVIDGQYYNTSSYTQEVRTIKIDDCTNWTNYIFNFTLKDEKTNTVINATNESGLIEVDLFINSDNQEILQYSSTESLTNPVYICSELDLENRGFNYDLDVGFSSDNRVNEFYFVDEGEIETGDTPFNISLMDLKTADSTSFLFNYFDVDGLPVDESIVQVWRKYIGDGVFREVERAKSDQNGDTIVHLVEEDVIYYFQITLNDTVLYTTSTYNALCQQTPCTIQIEASGSGANFGDEDDWDLIDGGAYSISSNPSTRQVTMTYALDDLGEMNLTVYKYNSDGSYSPVGSVAQTGTSGSISTTVPQSAGNVTFFASVFKDDEFKNSEWVDFEGKAQDRFGVTLALFIGALIILTLGLMAISEGVGTLVYVILGVALSGFLGLMTVELSTGVNIVVYLVVAGGILLWKLTGGRR